MKNRSVAYLDRLNEVSVVLEHQKILEQAKKILAPGIVSLVESYGKFLKELEQVVELPLSCMNPNLNEERIASYNACRKVSEYLKKCPLAGHETAVETLVNAFEKSIYRKSVDRMNATMDAAEQVIVTVPGEELEAFAVRKQVENFVKLNKDYRQSREAEKHNKGVRNKSSFYAARENCNIVYSCIVKVATNFAQAGNAECKTFITWLKG